MFSWLAGLFQRTPSNRIGVAGFRVEWEPLFGHWATQVGAALKCPVTLCWQNGKHSDATDGRLVASGRPIPDGPNDVVVDIPEMPTGDNIAAAQAVVAQALRDVLARLSGD